MGSSVCKSSKSTAVEPGSPLDAESEHAYPPTPSSTSPDFQSPTSCTSSQFERKYVEQGSQTSTAHSRNTSIVTFSSLPPPENSSSHHQHLHHSNSNSSNSGNGVGNGAGSNPAPPQSQNPTSYNSAGVNGYIGTAPGRRRSSGMQVANIPPLATNSVANCVAAPSVSLIPGNPMLVVNSASSSPFSSSAPAPASGTNDAVVSGVPGLAVSRSESVSTQGNISNNPSSANVNASGAASSQMSPGLGAAVGTGAGGHQPPNSARSSALPPVPQWQRGALIGSGAFGKVYLGLDLESGQLLAVKEVVFHGTITAIQSQVTQLMREISLMRQLDHPNIVRYIGAERKNASLYILMEYVPGGSLESLVHKFGSLTERVCRLYTIQMLQGLSYLHSHKILHRDIKGANILVNTDGTIKLADFGASKQLAEMKTMTGADGFASMKGTPYWMAPEVIKQISHGRSADVWSVGCTVIEMATGKPPWSEFTSIVAAMFHIADTNDMPAMPPTFSELGVDFLRSCFIRDPKMRPNADECLQHPWITQQFQERRTTNPNLANLAAAAAAGSGSGKTPANGHVPPTSINLIPPSPASRTGGLLSNGSLSPSRAYGSSIGEEASTVSELAAAGAEEDSDDDHEDEEEFDNVIDLDDPDQARMVQNRKKNNKKKKKKTKGKKKRDESILSPSNFHVQVEGEGAAASTTDTGLGEPSKDRKRVLLPSSSPEPSTSPAGSSNAASTPGAPSSSSLPATATATAIALAPPSDDPRQNIVPDDLDGDDPIQVPKNPEMQQSSILLYLDQKSKRDSIRLMDQDMLKNWKRLIAKGKRKEKKKKRDAEHLTVASVFVWAAFLLRHPEHPFIPVA
eukprot:ANDGO_05928.mRNA.1 Mitogen-activated protein kinase kinase kinase 2